MAVTATLEPWKDPSEIAQRLVQMQGQGLANRDAEYQFRQKKALNDELDALDKYSERAVQIAQQLAADLSDNERAELIGKLGDLQGTQGQQMTGYTGDIEAAEEAGILMTQSEVGFI